MNILIISNLYGSFARGGAEVVVKRTAFALSKLGHHVTILTAKPYEGRASFGLQEGQQDGIRLLSYYPFNLFFYPNDGKHALPVRLLWHAFDINNRHTAGVLRRHLASQHYDVVITHNLMGLGYSIPAEIRRAGIKHIHVLHDIQLAVRSGLMAKGQEGRFYTSGWLAKAYQAVTRRQFGSPDLVISPSEFLLHFYQQLRFFPSSKTVVLRNPVDARFSSVRQGASSGTLRFGYIGQLAAHKGLPVLKEATQALAKNGWSLTIVGNGAMADDVRAWAHADPRVTYPGPVPNERLPEVFSQIDMLILPTRTYENSPTVVFEALASGVPVIVSDIGGASEAVKEGENGFIVEPDSAESLSKAITACLALPPHQMEKMRESARASVQGLEADTYVKKLLSAL